MFEKFYMYIIKKLFALVYFPGWVTVSSTYDSGVDKWFDEALKYEESPKDADGYHAVWLGISFWTANGVSAFRIEGGYGAPRELDGLRPSRFNTWRFFRKMNSSRDKAYDILTELEMRRRLNGTV